MHCTCTFFFFFLFFRIRLYVYIATMGGQLRWACCPFWQPSIMFHCLVNKLSLSLFSLRLLQFLAYFLRVISINRVPHDQVSK